MLVIKLLKMKNCFKLQNYKKKKSFSPSMNCNYYYFTCNWWSEEVTGALDEQNESVGGREPVHLDQLHEQHRRERVVGGEREAEHHDGAHEADVGRHQHRHGHDREAAHHQAGRVRAAHRQPRLVARPTQRHHGDRVGHADHRDQRRSLRLRKKNTQNNITK